MRPPRSILLFLALLPAFGSHAQLPVSPDGPYRVAGVVMSGNKVTRPTIILRELIVAEGDTLPNSVELYDRLERSRQNLMNTGLFNSVQVMPVFMAGNEVLVEVLVNERWYIWPSPIFRLADPNFNLWWETRDLSRLNYGLFLNKYNFRGMNETVYLKLQFGYTQQFGLRYKVPFFDRSQRWGFSVGAYYTQQREITAGTVDNERILWSPEEGNARTEWLADAELSLRRGHDVRHYWRLGYIQTEVQDTVALLRPDYFRDGATTSTFLTAGYTFIWDRRDLRFYPRDGHYLEVKLDRYGLGVLDEHAPEVTTLYGTVKKWWKRGERWTVGGSLRGKTTLGGAPSYYVQEGLGYGHYVRGYEYYIVDGQHFALGKANLLFALIKPREYYLEPIPLEAFRTLYVAVYLNAFIDAGYTWDDLYAGPNPLANEWLGGYGLGLDLVTSYDQVLRVEYSVNALAEGGLFLHFSQPF